MYCSIESIFEFIPERVWYKFGVYDVNSCNLFVEKHFERNKEFIDNIITLRINGHISIGARVDEGLLRSSYEIEFYKLCKKYNIEFELEKRYPDSNMRCDFYINGVYIEIAPMYNDIENYKCKMDKKRALFNSMIIDTKNIDDYEDIVLGIKSNLEI
jgi:(2Fe-2S) ferredoxin